MSRATTLLTASLVAAAVAIGSWSGTAHATDEDDRTQPPESPEPVSASMGGNGSGTTGDDGRVRALLGDTEPAAWTFGWRAPSAKDGAAETAGEFRSSLTGWFRSRFVVGPSDTFTMHVRRDRAILDERGRIPFPAGVADPNAGTGLERWHDRASLDWRRTFSGGFLDETLVTAAYDAEGGVGSSLSGGRDAASVYQTNTFGTPSTLSFDRRSVWIAARATGNLPWAHVTGSARFRNDILTRSFDAVDVGGAFVPGSLDVHSNESRQSADAMLALEGAPVDGVRIGGSFREAWSRGNPRTSRAAASPLAPVRTFRSEDVDVSELRHRATLGALWLPLPDVRAGVRVQGESARITGSAIEDRQLATYQIADGRTTWTPWSASGVADASFSPAPKIEIDGSVEGRLAGGDDTTSRALLLSDRVTVADLFLHDLARPRQSSAGEVRAVARPWQRARFYAGERLSRDVQTATGAGVALAISDREATRATTFGGAHVRLARASAIDAKASVFHETQLVDGSRPVRDGIDTRVRASTTMGLASVWALGAWTDDRLALGVDDPLITSNGFRSRALVAGAGASAAVKKGFISLSASQARATGDTSSRLTEFSAEGGAPVGGRWSASAGVRWLELHDANAAWTDGHGLAGMVRLSARY